MNRTRLQRISDVGQWARWAGLAAGGLVLLAAVFGAHVWRGRVVAEGIGHWRDQLVAVADGRRAAIERWIGDRIGDATIVASLVAGDPGPADPPLGDARLSPVSISVPQLLRQFGTSEGDRGAWLLGEAKDSGALLGVGSPPCLGPAVATFETGEPRAGACPDGTAIVFSSPVDPGEATPRRPGRVVAIAADPRAFLFPLLERPAFPSRTGESLLVRLEGADVVFLSPLRHHGAPPGTLRQPLTRTTLATAAGLVGREWFGLSRDYRGAQVLAAIRPIKDTGWLLVVKVDRAEALEGAQAQLRNTALAGGGMLLALVGLGFGIVRQRTAAAQLALVRSEARFGVLLEHAADAILLLLPGGRIVRANGRAQELYGYSRGALESLRLHDLSPPAQADAVTRKLEALKHGSTLVYETEHRAIDGAVIPVEVSARSVATASRDGTVLAIVRDIRGRKEAERRLESLTRMIRTVSEINALMVREPRRERFLSEACRILVDHGGFRMVAIGFLDTRSRRIVPSAWAGYEEGYLAETVVTDEEAGHAGLGPAGESLRTGKPVTADVSCDPAFTPWRKAALSRGYASAAFSPIRSAGAVAGLLSVFATETDAFTPQVVSLVEELAADIGFAVDAAETRRRLAEAATTLVASKSFLEALIRSAPAAILTLDPEGCVGEIWNPAAEHTFGWRREEIVGRPAPFIPPDRVSEFNALRRLVAEGQSFSGLEVTRVRQDGTPVRLSLGAAPLLGPDGELKSILAIATDVTASREAEEALQQAREELQQSQRLEAVGRLAGGIAHDFNNLLAVMIGQSELAESSLAPGHAARGRLDQILEAAHRAADLTRQLLAFSRRQALRPRVVDLNATVSEIEKLLRRLIGEDVTLEMRLAPTLHPVRVDPSQIGQVLMNLAVNARDAMPDGGVLTIETSNIDVDLEYARSHPPMTPQSYAQIRVADNGTGMEEDVLEHIFEPFFTTKEEGTGTGLGLSTVYGIVKQSNGFIWVETAVGRGTTFTIQLPAVSQSIEETAQRHGRPDVVTDGSETVLVVEDQEQLRGLIHEILETAGYHVLSAPDAASALPIADAHAGPISLLLTDLVLPGMNGLELSAALSAKRPDTRTLLMSGYTSDVVSRARAQNEAVPLLWKPFGRTELLRAVREVMSRSGA